MYDTHSQNKGEYSMKHEFNPLIIRGKELIPIVQGGMGIGVSASGLSSAVARENGLGTIASVDLRHLHEDLLAESKINPTEEKYCKLNHIALDREIQAAKAKTEGRGMIAVNVMKAVKDHAALVRQACESGADAIVMGAGLPLDLPEMMGDYKKDIALLPILSESRGIGIVLKRWMKKGVLPDAIVIEHPAHAAGHLGAMTVDGVNDAKFDFPRVISETAFAVTQEGDAHINFKNTLAGAEREQIVEFMSVAGLPARGVNTRFLSSYTKRLDKLQANAKADPKRCTQGINCLTTCGLRDGLSKIGRHQAGGSLPRRSGQGLVFPRQRPAAVWFCH